MSALAGWIVPAAVINIGINFGKRSAAFKTALYPAILACDDKASIACARVVRGTASIENAVTFRAATFAIS